eukprot:CAMPEP_0183331772 /NCGR_PEP_ID=MMETSP0164_2-20130417/1096_1 /TAXON_ID=221442 /ORGANISM="Coccolithus pelagicus ssp braarudi, Strain PLY182g" /LENGTH=232 /DNA_ID=CAMNT_0025500343 /DNA_START=54 /DNA_END=748 /DNA_ORIENTATION=+
MAHSVRAGCLSCLLMLAADPAQVHAKDAKPVTEQDMHKVSEALQAGYLSAEGLDTFKANAEQNPTDWRAHAMLGQAWAHQEVGSEAAIDALRKAAAIAPAIAAVGKTLAVQLVASSRKLVDAAAIDRRTAEAIDKYQALLTLAPNDAEMYVQLGVLANQAELAARKASRGLKQTPSEAEGAHAEDRGQPLSEAARGGQPAALGQLALDAWLAATRLAPKHAEPHILLATKMA